MDRFRLFPVRSPLLRESLLLSIPRGTKMFQFSPFASIHYVFMYGCHSINRDRFPHSEISGSKPVSSSPKLIAAFHVLHRLSAPRHPPCALSSLVTNTKPSTTRLNTEYVSLVKDRLPVELSGLEPPASALQKRRSPR